MTVMAIPCTKGKTSIDIDTDKLPEDVYAEALRQGLKVLLNRGMSKITKAELGDQATVEKEANLKGAANLEAIYGGSIKFSGTKAKSGVSGAVKTEAMRLARNLIKDGMKQAGIKISHVEASEITKAARELLEGDPSIIETAKTNLEERSKVPVADTLLKSIKISDKKVAAAEKRKAEKATQLSAKQAGMTVKAKGKGKPAQATAH